MFSNFVTYVRHIYNQLTNDIIEKSVTDRQTDKQTDIYTRVFIELLPQLKIGVRGYLSSQFELS